MSRRRGSPRSADDPGEPGGRRGDGVLVEALRGVGLVTLLALAVLAVGALLAVIVGWVF